MSATWKALRIVESMALLRGSKWRGARALGAADSSGCARAGRRFDRRGEAVLGALGVDERARPAGRLDPLARAGAERVRVNGERLGQLAACKHLDRDVLALAQAVGLHQFDRHVGAGVEALLERLEVDRLRVRPERLERHRLLHVRPEKLSHAHVDRHLTALEARAALGARARARALLAAPGRLSRPRAFATTDALARPAATRGGGEAVQADP